MDQRELFSGLPDQIPKGDSKICTKCCKEKPLTSFGTVNGGLKRPECKSCMNKMVSVRDRLRRENQSPSENHICPICHQTADDVKDYGGKRNTPWVIDHCHRTDRFRGWLCHRCNRGIGCFSDDIEKLERAVDYLRGTK